MFAKSFPTIAVDGCAKQCAKHAIETYSGKTAAAIVVADLLQKWSIDTSESRRELDEQGRKTASRIAEHLATRIDTLFLQSTR
jgi:uncharacterized metal-binding protein